METGSSSREFGASSLCHDVTLGKRTGWCRKGREKFKSNGPLEHSHDVFSLLEGLYGRKIIGGGFAGTEDDDNDVLASCCLQDGRMIWS